MVRPKVLRRRLQKLDEYVEYLETAPFPVGLVCIEQCPELLRAAMLVLSDEAWKKLDRYRGFRHVVRNVHAFELDPEQIDLLMKRLPNAAEQAFGDLHAFADTLDRMADSEM